MKKWIVFVSLLFSPITAWAGAPSAIDGGAAQSQAAPESLVINYALLAPAKTMTSSKTATPNGELINDGAAADALANGPALMINLKHAPRPASDASTGTVIPIGLHASSRDNQTSALPDRVTMLLFGAGLIGLAGISRKTFKRQPPA